MTDFDQVVDDLLAHSGLTTIELDSDAPALDAFGSFEANLPLLREDSAVAIDDTLPAGHVTGYHAAASENGWSSRYNRYREGIVLSDGQSLTGYDDMMAACQRLQCVAEEIAEKVLEAMECRLELPKGWLSSELQPSRSSSQWHLKRFVEAGDKENAEQSTDSKELHVLPSHTDPSLISVVIHHRPSATGSQGLEWCDGGEWKAVPRSGHRTAVVLVGSVLSYLTGGWLPAPRHRVVGRWPMRMAATLFWRPAGSALLTVPPSPLLQDVRLRRRLTFEEWNAKVSKNYQTSKGTKTKQSCKPSVTFRDEHSELVLIPCDPPLTGREKYLGGELCRDGKIYTIPGHASRVLVIDAPAWEAGQTSSPVRPIGPSFEGEYKWLRGVLMSTGVIIGIPCHADAILCINPTTSTATTIDWDARDPRAPPKGMPWKWHGGQISPDDGCLYCIPQRAEAVLKFDPVTNQATFIGDRYPGRNKWYGGLLGRDGAIYGVNQNHPSILRIDPKTQSTSLHGNFPEGGFKWHGGVVGTDGNIYGIPAHADTVLKIEPGDVPRITTFGGPLRSGQHRPDNKYKFLGGTVGCDQKIYFFPSDADFVLQVDPKTQQCREVGPDLRELEKIHQNKWQNGFSMGGCIYGIPLKAESILRIRPLGDGRDPEITTIGGGSPFTIFNKWEGGVLSLSGSLYCMPLNHASVLQIRPL